MSPSPQADAAPHGGSSKRLYLWVLLAIVIGGAIGHYAPDTGVALKPLGDGFIGLIKMLIAPIIFLTVVMGIAGVADVKKVGRVGVKAILYFEVVSSVALLIGLLVVICSSRAPASMSIRRRSMPAPSRATRKPRTTRARSASCCTSFPRRSPTPSPATATCCKCCWWRCCLALR